MALNSEGFVLRELLVGIDHECAADPEPARWALLGICRADQQNQNGARRNGAAHDLV